MIPIFALLAGFGLLALLEKRHSAITASGGTVTGATCGGGAISKGFAVLPASNSGLGILGGKEQAFYQQNVQALNFVPVVGPALSAAAGAILGAISKHHAQALAAEGKALNDALPRMIQTFALIVQACAKCEITSQSQANQLADKTLALYYAEVKPIQRGNWPYKGDHFPEPTYDDSWGYKWKQRAGGNLPDDNPPGTCNAACGVGHWFAERGSMLVKYACRDILAGKHGSVVFPQVPAHATQQGYPQTAVTY